MTNSETKLALQFSAWITESHECWANGEQSVLQNLDKLDYILPCLLSCTATGGITDCVTEQTKNLDKLCRVNGLPQMPLLAGDPADVSTIIRNDKLTQIHISTLLNYVVEHDYIGIDVDYEFLPDDDKDAFTAFMANLTSEFDKHGKLVSVDLHPKVRPDDPWSIGARAQDWKALTKCTHILRVMCYDQYHPAYKYPEAGPISTLPWTNAVIAYAADTIPADKLIIGLPFYAGDYDITDPKASRNLFYREVMELQRKHGAKELWHEVFAVPHFNYTDDAGHDHEVWYENGRSIKGKAALARKYGVKGISCWAISDEDPAVWQSIAQELAR